MTLLSCASVKPYYKDGSQYIPPPKPVTGNEVDYSLFFAGGVSLKHHSPVLTAIEDASMNLSSGLVLLGDVLSIDELPSDAIEKNASEILTIKSLDNKFNELLLIPGEKEWSSEKKISHTAVSSLDKLLKDVKKNGRLVEPRKGCGYPEVVRISDNTVLALLDSQWAIEAEKKQGEKNPGCEIASVLELRQAVKDIIQAYPDEFIIFTSHHPVFVNGPTAGNYPLTNHLLPVPVIGTLFTGIKTLIASEQHFNHPAYEAYRSVMTSALSGCKNCIVISGHEKSLQAYKKDEVYYLVAGSGSEVSHARKGEGSEFSYMSPGFIRADILKNGNIQLAILSVNHNTAVPVWQTTILPNRVLSERNSSIENILHQYGDSIVMQASTLYSEKKFLRGDFYREAWSEPISIPVLWLDEAHGGLKPVQLGGGNQTRSLRLENDNDEQYVLRSIDKKVTSVIPFELRGSFAENIVQDGIAASHPYGALVVPRLAEAADIYYTNPSVVYVPHQPALDIYDAEIGDGVYLFEERPGGNTEDFENFGNTEETINTLDLIEAISGSHKHKVDQKAVLRARLFDIWLGDWDRHDDQWRWAAFEKDGVTEYKPIPRDRDQVFFYNDGVLDYLASRPYFNPPLRRFDEEIDYLEGLVWAGKYFDRSFLHELTSQDFINEAKSLQAAWTDQIIEEAFMDWPAEIDILDGDNIRKALKKRRDDLVMYTDAYYRHLSKEILIPATDDPDVISIHALDNNSVRITAHRRDKGELYMHYDRTVSDEETREVRIFGLSKKDTFHLTGDGHPSVIIRLIGGGNEDVVINETKGLKIIAYDDPDGLSVTGNPVTSKLNDKPFNNTYDRTDWNLNRSIHFPLPAYYTDEGIGLSYNVWLLKHGFRSEPYRSKHTIAASYFFNTAAFIADYSGDWPNAFGELDFKLDMYGTGPTFTQYYYGLGNEYIDYGEKNKFHIVKGSQIRLSPSVGKRFGFGSRVFIEPSYQFINVEDSHSDPRFIYSGESKLTSDDFGQRHYAGIRLGYSLERLDNAGYPTRGGNFEMSLGGRTSLSQNEISHGLLSAGGALYIPFNTNGTLVLATHLQGDKIIGDYEFFHALTLGGPDKLRGFRRDRFAGDSRFYHATDLRFTLFRNRGLIPFSLGVYGAADYGRVWYEDDSASANKWHTAFGGGIFIVPFGLSSFRIGYMAGEDDKQINIGGALRFK